MIFGFRILRNGFGLKVMKWVLVRGGGGGGVVVVMVVVEVHFLTLGGQHACVRERCVMLRTHTMCC